MAKRLLHNLSRLLAGGLLLGLAACGSSDTTTPPVVPDNPFAAARVGTDTTLEVMTWNLETFPINGSTTVDLVTKAIAGLDVDIVAVQEIYQGDGHPGRSSFDAVAAGLDGWDGFRSTDDGYMDLGFFYRSGGDLVVTSFTDVLTHEDNALPRAPLVMQATWRGAPIVVINNHYKCCSDGVERRRQASLLLEQYVLDTFGDTPVIIVGDLNDELTDPPAENVFANFLADTARWRFADLAIAQGAGGRVSYPGWPSHIDHILITDELFAASEKAGALVEVVPLNTYLGGGMSAYYRDLSDHLPVLLRLTP